jgi:hypothetical protein
VTGWALFLAIVGPVLTAAGAFLLARDMRMGLRVWYHRDYFGTRSWELLRQFHEQTVV